MSPACLLVSLILQKKPQQQWAVRWAAVRRRPPRWRHTDYLCLLVLEDIKRKETDNVKFDLNSNKLITFSLEAQFKLCYLILKMYIILSFIHPVYLARFHCFANRTKQVKDRSVVDLIALRLITSISRLLDDRSPRPPTGPTPTAVSRPWMSPPPAHTGPAPCPALRPGSDWPREIGCLPLAKVSADTLKKNNVKIEVNI